MPDAEIFEPEGRSIPFAVEGSGPGLVLLTGGGSSIELLGPLAHSVSQEDFRVVRIGWRDAKATPVSLSDPAQCVVDVMDHLGMDAAWVGGHARGGSIARQVSLQYPARVSGVLLLGVESADVAPPLAPDVPVLVIQGTSDEITPPANGAELRAAAPDRVSVVPIDGAGHMFPMTHVGATSWAIEDYLDWD